jgi:RNA recognition motif-containing protein
MAVCGLCCSGFGRVIKDASTGRSRGFGFVSYDSAQAAQAAILELDGLRVSIWYWPVVLRGGAGVVVGRSPQVGEGERLNACGVCCWCLTIA